MGGRPGYIFEIFENGHIFLKFYFFFKYKKEKTAGRGGEPGGRGGLVRFRCFGPILGCFGDS